MFGSENNSMAIPEFWAIYAAAKYLGRDLHGERHLDKQPATLNDLADALIAICELTWRSGFRPLDLQQAAMRELRRRKMQRCVQNVRK